MNYQVIEDNAGGMFLFFMDDDGKVVLGIENIEHVQPGDLDQVVHFLVAARTWDSQLPDPQETYEDITSFEFGWKVVADKNGVYPERMGRAAQAVYEVEE